MSTPAQYTQIPVDTLSKMTAFEPPQPEFGAFIRGITVKLAAEDIAVNRSENRRAALVQNFYRGNQRVMISPYDLSARTMPYQKGDRSDPRLIHNWFRPMSRAITGQWTLARTDVVVLPLPTESHDVHVAGGARYATKLAERLQSLIMTETWRQTRAKYAQFTGMNAFYSYWDAQGMIDTAGARYAPMATKPVMEMRDQAISQGGYQCDECGYGGPLEEANQTQACPACGSQNLSVEQPVTMKLPVVTGYEHQPLGFLCSRQVPRWQIKWDRMAATFGESSYFLWEFPMRDEVIREAYPFWRIGQSAEGTDDRGSMRTENELRNQPGNVPSFGTSQRSLRTRQSVIRNWWLSPCWYRRYKFEHDYQLANGLSSGGQIEYETIPAGTWAIDKWPTGCFVTTAGVDLLGLVDEEKLDHWLLASYDLIPGQLGGDGIEDGIPGQRRINKAYALKDADMENCAGAGAIFNPNYIDRADIPSDPFTASPVKQSTPSTVDLRTQVVAHIERPNMGQTAQVAVEEMIRQMEYQLGAEASGTGQSGQSTDADSRTATEAMLKSQGAKSQRSPELSLASEADCALLTQWLRLFQRYATDEVAIPMKGENGEFEWEWFKGSMIPANFLVTTRTRGSAPKADEDLQSDFRSAFEMVGGFQGLPIIAQQYPRLLEQVEERWGVDFKLNNLGRIATLVRYRIDIMTANLQQAGQVDPQIAPMLAQDPRVVPDPREPHDLFISKYDEWLLGDECQKARVENPAKIGAVHAMIQLHEEAKIQQAQQEQISQMQEQAPAMQMQQEQQQQQAEQQMAQHQQQGQQKMMQMYAQEKAKQEATKEQHKHESQMTAKQQTHDVQLERMRARVQVKKGKQ